MLDPQGQERRRQPLQQLDQLAVAGLLGRPGGGRLDHALDDGLVGRLEEVVELGDAAAARRAGPAPSRGPSAAGRTSRAAGPGAAGWPAAPAAPSGQTRTRRICRGVPPSVSGVNSSGSCWKLLEERRQRRAGRGRRRRRTGPAPGGGRPAPRRRRPASPRRRRPPSPTAPCRAPTASDVSRQVPMVGVEQLLLEHAAAVVLDQRVVGAGRLGQRVGVDGVEQRQQPLPVVAGRAQPAGQRRRRPPPAPAGQEAGRDLPQPGQRRQEAQPFLQPLALALQVELLGRAAAVGDRALVVVGAVAGRSRPRRRRRTGRRPPRRPRRSRARRQLQRRAPASSPRRWPPGSRRTCTTSVAPLARPAVGGASAAPSPAASAASIQRRARSWNE